MRSSLRGLWLVLAAVLLCPSAAFADTWFTFFGGMTTFGSTPENPHKSSTSPTYGGSIAFKGKAGVEIDWSYFNKIAGSGAPESSNARTLMANFIIDAGPRRGRVQPYVSGGAGLVSLKVITRSDLFKASGDFNDDLGINVGGGVLVATGSPISARVDARYFRDLDSHGDLKLSIGFFRITGGVVFGF